MTKTGFIGLGRMGAGMATHLMQTTGQLLVHDTSVHAMDSLVKKGATICDSAADMASRSNLIFLCLPYAPEVRTALFGDNGISSTAREGFTVIDTTTLDRTDALAIGAEAAEHGIQYWDCPVSGMPFRADNGTLTVMFGGTDDAFATHKPLLSSFGEVVSHCGPLGSGQAMKALNNIIYNVNIAVLCEVLPLAQAVGLDPQEVANVVTSASSRSFASEYFVPRMLDGRFDTDFSMKDAYKDIVNVQRMALETQASLPVVNAMIGSYLSAMASGHGGEPKSAMIKVYEKALGVTFRNPADD